MLKTNRRLILAAALGFMLGLAVRDAASAQPTRVEDCIAAVVNDQIVTLVDIKIVERFGLCPEKMKGAALSAVLDELIARKLVIEFARGRTALGDDEIETSFKALILKLGSENVQEGLEKFGFEESDLRPYLTDGLLYEKILSSRFTQNVPVSLREIEDYYRNIYLPSREKEGAEPLPMIQMLDLIETDIRTRKRDDQIAAWINSLRIQADIRINKDCLK